MSEGGSENSMKSMLSDPDLRAANIQFLIREAQKLKEEGNQFMKQGDTKKALLQYHLAHLKTKGGMVAKSPSMNPDSMGVSMPDDKKGIPKPLENELVALHISILNNMAVCLGKDNKNERVVTLTSEVISLDPDNFKAILRRCNALVKSGKLARAEQDFEKAYKLDPTDKEIQRLKAFFDERNNTYKQQEKERMKGMFDRM